MPGSATRANALDHVVVVLFENRSLDNVLGRLYGPGDGKTFEGVLGKELGNPIPDWAEHGADRKVVPYGISADMDSPNPDSGEEWYHTNTQLFGTIDDHNRGKIGEGVTAPWNAPPPGAAPAMDGFVADYISTFSGEIGRQPTYEEYAQIMTGYTPEQLPVLSGIAREFGVFDHWFSEVPSQTFMNRSFWTAATSSGLVVNSPVRKWFTDNDAETIFERLEQHGRTWKVYVMEPMCLSFTGIIHYPRLKDRLATHFVPFVEFEKDAAAGTLPDFSLIEPDMIAGHGDYHPAFGRSFFGGNVDIGLDPVVGDAGRRGVPGTGLQRLPVRHLTGGRQRLEHSPADRVGRARRNLRPRATRAGPAARPGRPAGRARLHLRPIGLPGARHRRLALGRAGLGVQPGVPAHLADRDAAQGLAPRRGVHPARCRSAHLRAHLHPRDRATRRHGPPSRPSPSPHGRLTTRPWARPSATWARRPDLASSSTPGRWGSNSRRNSTTPPPNSHHSSSSKSSGTSPSTTSPGWRPAIAAEPKGHRPRSPGTWRAHGRVKMMLPIVAERPGG